MTTNPVTRLFTLIMLLQRQPNQKAAELAGALGVSVRTLHRYVSMLDELGIPIYSERGPGGGFSLVRGYRMPPLVFTTAEAAALCLGTGLVANLWGELYDEAAQSALAKLENVLPESQLAEIEWARRTLVTTPLPRAGLDPFAALLEPLRGAIRAGRRVKMVYQGGVQSAPIEREVDPYALAYRQGWWYVVGQCHLRRSVRCFRVDRIQALDVLDDTFSPDGFDAQQALDFDFSGQTPVRVRMRLLPGFGYLATNTPAAWESLEVEADGSVSVTTSLGDLTMACVFAMSYGPAATVLEPEPLRQMVREWAAAMVKQYGGTEAD